MRNTLILVALTLSLTPLCLKAETNSGAPAEAQILFESLTRHFAGIHTLSYTAERSTKGRRQSARERWTLSYEAPGLVRVDYQYPAARQLVITTNTLYEYIPALRRAVQTDLERMSDKDRAATIKQTLARISLDGINPSSFQDMAARSTSVSMPSPTSAVRRITGANPKFVIDLDTQRNVLLTTDIYTSTGDLLLHTEASSFTEATPGFWYPEKLDAGYLTEQGFINTSTTLSAIKINTPLPPGAFRFTPPAHTTVDTR
jgi:outer membrane lipoprotein-sorting protein